MKTKIISIMIALTFSGLSLAGNSLQTLCKNYSGEFIQNVKVSNYNTSSINSGSTNTSGVNVRFSNTADWFKITSNNPSMNTVYDLAKTARLTGESVDACVNRNGKYLLGLEWYKTL